MTGEQPSLSDFEVNERRRLADVIANEMKKLEAAEDNEGQVDEQADTLHDIGAIGLEAASAPGEDIPYTPPNIIRGYN